MLKMYHNQAHSGATPDFWEDNWETSDFEKSVAFCAVDPLRPLFEKYLTPDSLMLEGGCGIGNYVSYYAAMGYNVVGLDFAQNALRTLRKRQPNLKLTGGDVSKLPFANETFDLYYSGGVVEHFEGGADDALKEARRILKKSGVLLISVPYYSPLRKMLSPFKRAEWRSVDHPQIETLPSYNGKEFFQYAYTRKEFTRLLNDAGLRVVSTQGYAVIWGLYELPFFSDRSKFATNSNEIQKEEKVTLPKVSESKQSSLIKRLIVSEDDSVPVLGLGVKFMRWLSANMMMYVCVREESQITWTI